MCVQLQPAPLHLGGFISFWGFVFLGSAGFVFLKRERPDDAPTLTVVEAYKQAVAVMRLPAVLKLCAILLTRAMAFSAAETLTQLKVGRCRLTPG